MAGGIPWDGFHAIQRRWAPDGAAARLGLEDLDSALLQTYREFGRMYSGLADFDFVRLHAESLRWQTENGLR